MSESNLVCEWCNEPVEVGERADVQPAVIHRECAFRAIVGPAAHILKECSCFGGTRHDPPGISKREAAGMAFEAGQIVYARERGTIE